MKVVILAGGSGTRLWPLSRKSFPKQFLHFGDGQSLLQKTVLRFLPVAKPEEMVILTHQDYFHLVKAQVGKIDPILEGQIVLEPCSRNTGPAICLAVKYMQEKMGAGEDLPFLVTSSDHLLSPQEAFVSALKEVMCAQALDSHVIFGVRPHKPETAYGHVKARPGSGLVDVEAFVEKPNHARAQEYLLSGEYLWNAGIFLFRIGTFLEDVKRCSPPLFEGMQGSFEESVQRFDKMPEISIDYALMEKSSRVKVFPLDLAWSDVGSWDGVYDVLDKDRNANVKVGNVLDVDTKNCLILGGKRLISTVGLEDLLVIETEDALFIGKKGSSQHVKHLVEELKKRNAKEPLEHLTTHRPWGRYTILEEAERYKIKRIVVEPLQKLSLQMHYHRSEHWVVVKGTAKVTIGEKELLVHENESVYVEKSMVHRLENPGKVPLELIEVQVGEYVGEDDIVRYEDIYARA